MFLIDAAVDLLVCHPLPVSGMCSWKNQHVKINPCNTGLVKIQRVSNVSCWESALCWSAATLSAALGSAGTSVCNAKKVKLQSITMFTLSHFSVA